MDCDGMLWFSNVLANLLVAMLRVNDIRRRFGIFYIALVLGSVLEVNPRLDEQRESGCWNTA
jgi:hypothetical protein